MMAARPSERQHSRDEHSALKPHEECWRTSERGLLGPRLRQSNVATTPAPPVGTVIVQTFVGAVVQPCQTRKVLGEIGVAVRAIEVPTGTTAMHVTDGQLIPYVRLVTVPVPLGVICTLNVASVPPPGQVGSAGLFTVTVA